MEGSTSCVALPPQGTQILKQSLSSFIRVLEEKFGCTAEIHNVEDHAASYFAHSKIKIVPEMKYSKQVCKNLTVSVWKDDLTQHKADAVVNAANEYLTHGAGLAFALSKAGGPTIQKDSRDIINSKGIIPTGDVVETPAGNLPCKVILHAVGPSVSSYASNKEIESAAFLLRKTIWNILKKCETDKLQSVAIPAISSGLFNFPLDLCADNIVDVVRLFSATFNPGAWSLEVHLVNNDDPSVNAMERACIKILGQSERIPMQNPSSAPSQAVLSRLDLGDVTLSIKKGAIEEENADVIVNTIGTDLHLNSGLVSKAILSKAGPKIQDELTKRNRGHVSAGDVLPTGGYKLNCKEVYHTICAPRSYKDSTKTLRSLIIRCLERAVKQGYSSIHFPAIGTGNLGFEKDEVSEIMTSAVVTFSKGCKKKINVCFVIFPKDTESIKAFEKQMAATQKSLHSSAISSSISGQSSRFHDSVQTDPGTTPSVTLLAPSPEALREAQLWCVQVLQMESEHVTINNNHVVHFSQDDHLSLMKLQGKFKVIITEFIRGGKGGIIINGESVGVGCARLEVEAMLCKAQEEFAQSEEKYMQDDLGDDSGQQHQLERISKTPYKKTPIDINSDEVKKWQRNFSYCDLNIVKVEKIENHALKRLYEFKSRRIQAKPKHLYQCVKAQYCNLICRVGFQREYAPPKEQKYGAGIYFATELETAKSLWPDSEEEYVYFIEALVLTGKDTLGSSELIVPPPIDKDPLVRYDSVSNLKDIIVIFNGQQAYPEFLITCKKRN